MRAISVQQEKHLDLLMAHEIELPSSVFCSTAMSGPKVSAQITCIGHVSWVKDTTAIMESSSRVSFVSEQQRWLHDGHSIPTRWLHDGY